MASASDGVLKKVNLGEPAELAGDALVVGGVTTAMDAARSAWRAGARSVRVLYRRTREDMPAQADELRAAEHEGVVIDTLVLANRRGPVLYRRPTGTLGSANGRHERGDVEREHHAGEAHEAPAKGLHR